MRGRRHPYLCSPSSSQLARTRRVTIDADTRMSTKNEVHNKTNFPLCGISLHASPKVRKLHFSDFACFTWRFHGSETVQARSIPGSADACALSGAHDAPRLIFLYTSSTETQSYPYWIDMRLYNNTRIYGISFPDATHTHKHKEYKTCGCPTIPHDTSGGDRGGWWVARTRRVTINADTRMSTKKRSAQ